MTIKIEITCDNAAFHDDPGEAARIIREAANKVADMGEGCFDQPIKLYDINGNAVGSLTVSGRSLSWRDQLDCLPPEHRELIKKLTK